MNLNNVFIKIRWIIIAFFDYIKFNKDLKKIMSSNKECYVLFSHEADQSGGAPVVLYELAKSIMEDNKCIIFFYKRGGNLIKKCKNKGMYAYVYEGNLKSYIKKLHKISINCIIVNTVVCGKCVEEVQKIKEVPILWWIHEIGKLVDKFCYGFPKSLNSNVFIKGVTEKSCESMQKYYKDYTSDIMFYGCVDLYKKHISDNSLILSKTKNIYNIIVIGQICERKNQLQIFRVYDLLPQDLKNIFKITFVASTWNKEYKKKFDDEIIKYKNMKFINGISHEDIYKLYLSANLLLCPSIEDPLPVVVTEAMMLKCPVLVSSGCGQYKYIKDGVNGFIYEYEKDDNLVNALKKSYENRSNNEIIENARQLYLEKFSLESLKKNIYLYENKIGI